MVLNKRRVGLAVLLFFLILPMAAPNFVKRTIAVAVLFKDALSSASPVVIHESRVDSFWENGFEITMEIQCNRFVDRMISIRFDPVVQPHQMPEGKIGGISLVTVFENDHTFEREFDLNRYGMRLLGSLIDGQWSARGKYIGEYPAFGSVLCDSQTVHVRVENLNFDPRDHEITVSVERYFLR